jgi:hypothetical protein
MFAAACAATTPSLQDGTGGRERGAVYKPGQSIAEARLCTCRECLERSCCAGDGDAEHVEPELGMTLAACGRCVRRVWTVRGAASCEASAGPECCPGTASQ